MPFQLCDDFSPGRCLQNMRLQRSRRIPPHAKLRNALRLIKTDASEPAKASYRALRSKLRGLCQKKYLPAHDRNNWCDSPLSICLAGLWAFFNSSFSTCALYSNAHVVCYFVPLPLQIKGVNFCRAGYVTSQQMYTIIGITLTKNTQNVIENHSGRFSDKLEENLSRN